MHVHKSHIFSSSLKLSALHTLCAITFILTFWVPYAFQKTYFHKMKDGETQQITQFLNTTDDNPGLTESASASTKLHNAREGI
jgi:hypothetical protein